ncbi:hypothetical protein ACFYV7_21060 [Nocardia suismassiliense]|uniref:Uncharacterized protein n=1 Tax=Nocardia suismassiliense TaxID=2077092 RepID=A0ABW6QVM1_9NOCA
MKTEKQPRLGVDFGRVIQGAALRPGDDDTVFLSGGLDEALRTPPSPDAFDVLPRLVRRFGGRAWVISKCGVRIEQRTRQWLDHHDFYDRTGIPRDNLRFCRKRADKAGHCAALGITHMIDDRIEVHHHLRDQVPHLFLFGAQAGPVPDWVQHVPTWLTTETAVTATLTPEWSTDQHDRSW